MLVVSINLMMLMLGGEKGGNGKGKKQRGIDRGSGKGRKESGADEEVKGNRRRGESENGKK